MTEFYNSPIYWAWSLFLSISWLAQGAFISKNPVNYGLRLWWIIFLNAFFLTASHITRPRRGIEEYLYSDGLAQGLVFPVVLAVAVSTALILQEHSVSKEK